MKTLSIEVTGETNEANTGATNYGVAAVLLEHAVLLAQVVGTENVGARPITLTAFGVTCTVKLVEEPTP